MSTADKDESSNFSLLHQSELSNPLSSDSHILSFGMSPGQFSIFNLSQICKSKIYSYICKIQNFIEIFFLREFSGKPTAIVKPCNKTLIDEKDGNYESVSELKSENNTLKDNLPSERPEILANEMEDDFALKENLKPEVMNSDANVSKTLETENFVKDPILNEKTAPNKESIAMDKGKNSLIRKN